jgi:ribonuclease T2
VYFVTEESPPPPTHGLGAHEWPKHGTCAAWADAAGTAHGLDQAGYYAAMFNLAQKEGIPQALLDAAGSSIPLADLQAIFGGAKRVALGCTSKCELVQVLTCYSQGKRTADDPAGPTARADCPCTGVRDSHYDNSCAEAHACVAVKVLSPQQTGCSGSGPEPSPGPGPSHKCAGGAQCCPGVKGPACTSDADCAGESGCARCAHSGHCTNVPLPP